MKNREENIGHKKITQEDIWQMMHEIYDPEVPVLSIVDLGIVRKVDIIDGNKDEPEVIITITPTYSGCPAMDVISMNIKLKLLENGIKNFQVDTVLSPAWTTDWMSESGKIKLKQFGIAPPNPSHSVCSPGLFSEQEAIQCPHCNSYNTKMISRFGSTACKALYQCNECLEPFDYFKCH